ncbi:Alcohol dehydrogenase [Bacillus rhizoplanae]|uniref:alcohol dehydrogenase n=1 Tax=Bacillus rhizoplanae TaxID=2880966 RepID=A0ABM8Y6V8_9BACI|nr:hypothetical protein [Bacillus rhizoplanae]CAG9611464.1 Alcohol dehydrogenase [Bacillus rhizoplanae]
MKIVGAIVATRKELQEVLQFAAEGKVNVIIETHHLHEINDVFSEREEGKINGRVVLDMTK